MIDLAESEDGWIIGILKMRGQRRRVNDAEVNKKAKKNEVNIQPLDQTRLVNNEVIARTKGKIFLAGPTREIPSEHLREVSRF